jgi:DNA adenine methylase
MPNHKAVDLFGERPVRRIPAKPFVKWAGGKGNLLQKLEALLPTDFDDLKNVTYIEPFVGGGAMLFHMLQRHKCITRAVINDINADLIRCYQLIANNPQILIDRLKNIENNYFSVDFPARKELFYAYRDQYNSEGIHPDERAALFIFLNHTCFNGLYRVNAAGKFNVPYGRYKKPVICNKEVIMADHRLLNSIELMIRQPGDYKLVRQNLSRNHPNFVYFDPPYRPLNDTSSFREYSNDPFDDIQQEELKEFCDRLSNKNCLIMLSNSDSKTENGDSYFEKLYQGYRFERIMAPRFINANGEKREKLAEVVIRNY